MKLDSQGRKVYQGDGSYDFEATVDGEDILVSKELAIPFSYTTAAVALPVAGFKETVGTPLPGVPLGASVRVWSPKTNKTITVPLVAVAPGRKPKGSGGAIKLSSAAYTALGLVPGSTEVDFRIFGASKFYNAVSNPPVDDDSTTPFRKLAKSALVLASKRIGIQEKGSSNWGPEVANYLASVSITDAAPWCAAFIYYCLKLASSNIWVTLPDFVPKSGYTPDWKNAAINNGRWIKVSSASADNSKVKPGDLALFYKSSLGRIGHIEIVEKVTSNGVWCIGGNTKSQDGNDVERNGGEVARNFRRWGALGTKGGFFSFD